MTGSVWDWTLADFRDRAASDAATPGGGSAAMVSAAIGIGLVLMALRISARKPERADAIYPLVESGERLLDEISGHADTDIAVFDAYMATLKLPKESDEQKTTRRTAISRAAAAATEVPLNAAQSALEALDIARQAATVANAGVMSDVMAGATILNAAVAAVMINVDINLKSITDPDLAASYAKSRAHLASAAADRHAAIAAVVGKRLV